MKTRFLQPTFEGVRFAEHTLPLEVARDLAAYEKLVIELAKQLYLRKNPDRQRVPKGFADDFHLHLESIKRGSAQPVLAIVTDDELPFDQGMRHYFEQARDIISECIAAPEGRLPDEFPKELLTHFNLFGRSLREDERMTLRNHGKRPSVLTPERRKHLVLMADKEYEREIELTGTIGEADWEKGTFRLRLVDGSIAVFPMVEDFHRTAREFGGRTRHQFTISGSGMYDSWDKLQKVKAMDTYEIQLNFELAERFKELSTLSDGWLDGDGKAPDAGKLRTLADKMTASYPDNLALPELVPTPEGNLLLEWQIPGDPSVDIALDSLKAYFHSFLENGSDVVREFDLRDDAVWNVFFEFLTVQFGSGAV
jgi:hypothetical protein